MAASMAVRKAVRKAVGVAGSGGQRRGDHHWAVRWCAVRSQLAPWRMPPELYTASEMDAACSGWRRMMRPSWMPHAMVGGA